jgi:cell wall-associated NlpC family hydrolase
MARRILPLAVCALVAAAPAQAASSGGTGGTAYSAPLPATSAPQPPSTPLTSAPAAILSTAGVARAPRSAPRAVKLAIAAANKLQHMPYRWGGGHKSFVDTGYDCSGTVSYILHGAGLLASPLDSTGLMSWGLPGPGRWITVYANAAHTYAMVAGLRLDTSGGPGPRWHALARSNAGFAVRHPPGL